MFILVLIKQNEPLSHPIKMKAEYLYFIYVSISLVTIYIIVASIYYIAKKKEFEAITKRGHKILATCIKFNSEYIDSNQEDSYTAYLPVFHFVFEGISYQFSIKYNSIDYTYLLEKKLKLNDQVEIMFLNPKQPKFNEDLMRKSLYNFKEKLFLGFACLLVLIFTLVYLEIKQLKQD